MALYSRRVIDRCLSGNRALVSDEKLRDWVRRLNTVSDDYVATEWELVLLNAFAKCGKVQHEPPTLAAPLDLIFESSDGRVQFGADIAAISDREMTRRNLVDRFQEELCKRITQAKIENYRFMFRVDEEQPIAARGTGRKRKLLVPAASQLSTHVFNADFDRFMEGVRTQPHVVQSHVIRNASPAISVSIQYSPAIGSAVCGHYGSYTSTTIKDKIPYSTLSIIKLTSYAEAATMGSVASLCVMTAHRS
jgi:hypothetical protein